MVMKTGTKRDTQRDTKRDIKGYSEAVLSMWTARLADTERDGHRVAFNAAFEESGLDWNWASNYMAICWRLLAGRSASIITSEITIQQNWSVRNWDSWIASLHKIEDETLREPACARRHSFTPGR